MIPRQTAWPRQWLMTDERIGERLWEAVERLPRNDGGVVFRHYATGAQERRALARGVAEACRRRGLVLAIARDGELARAVGADLIHNPAEPPAGLPFSRAVHSITEADAAREQGAALVFVSPVFPTRSHPGQVPLGIELALRIARTAGVPAIALGGMDANRFAKLEREGFYGWAAIDAWLKGPSCE